MVSRSAAFVAVALLASVALFYGDKGRIPDFLESPESAITPTSREAFDQWLSADVERASQFRRFEEFLASSDVSNVVPPWQLTRIDPFYLGKCDAEAFLVPPENLWGEIVPALRLVRSYVVPAVGEVQVLSSYRAPEVNICARGASRSNHLDFEALDLKTKDRRSGVALYRRLCSMHETAGPASGMGLGAYFDADDPDYAGGRFHIDAEGFRSWGRDYTRASSPCPVLTKPPS